MSKKFSYISLFSGAMGLDLGIEEAGGELLLTNDIDKGAVATIRKNRPNVPVIDTSVADVAGQEVLELAGIKRGQLDLLCGGPPCQSFSVYGNRQGAVDPRGQLVFEYIRMLNETFPKTFIMENVRGLHSMALVPKKQSHNATGYQSWMSEKGSLLKILIEEIRSIGYNVQGYLVNSVNYGAPQIRERLFLVGSRIGPPPRIPNPTHSNRPEEGLLPFRTLRDVIGDDFVDQFPEIMDFSARKKKYLSLVPPGGNWRSLPIDLQKESMGKSWYLKGGRSATWRRLSWDFPSPTVVTMPNHASTSMCHPEHIRALTVGECAAIQEFPDSWDFCGTTAEKYRQIGNAVPVRLGRIAGDAVAYRLHGGQQALEDAQLPPDAVVDQFSIIHLRPHVRTKRYWHNGMALAGDHDYYESEKTSRQLHLFQ
jgi:DNA (cytosine-5)-methyltransferase 1